MDNEEMEELFGPLRAAGWNPRMMDRSVVHYDNSDESKEDFDELLMERNKAGRYWLHFAVRPSGNRRKVRMM